MKTSSLQIYVDTKVAEIMLSDDGFRKNAGVLDTIKNSIVNYFDSHMDPNNKVGSFLNFIVPGTLSMLIGGWLGPTLGLAMRVLDIDVASLLSSVYDKVKGMVTDGKQINSSEIDDAVQASIQEHSGQELQAASSVEEYLANAKFLKMAVVNHYNGTMEEKDLKIVFAAGRRGKALSTIGRLLAWIIKAAAVSAGLMVAGDAANKLLGRPNAFDGSLQEGKPVEKAPEAAPPALKSKQTKFPIKAGYSDTQYNQSTNWIERYPNTESGIENMLIAFAKDVYDGLDGLEAVIMASPTFKTTVNNIAWYNHSSAGDPIVFLPKHFTSKKQLVDFFIDDVAARTAGTLQNPPVPPGMKQPSNVPPGSVFA